MSAYPANRRWIAASMILAALVNGLGNSMIGVALPQMRASLGVTVQEMVWPGIVAAIASTVMIPLSAWLGARLGRRRVLLAGLGLLSIGNLASGLSGTLQLLAASRFFAALGGGVLIPINQAIMAESFPPAERAQALAIYSFANTVAAVLGPVLGGLLIDRHGWHASYLCASLGSLCSLVIVLRLVHDPPHFERRTGPIDYPGILLLLAAISCFQILLQSGGTSGWFDEPRNVLCAGAALGAALLFIAQELETEHPAVDLSVLRDRALGAAALIGVVQATVLQASGFHLPIYLQDVLGYTAFQSAATTFPQPLVWLLTTLLLGRLSGRIAGRVPPGALVTLGLLIVGGCAWSRGGLTLDTGPAETLLTQGIQGLGMACIVQPLWWVAYAGVDRRRMPHATAIFNLIVLTGGSCGNTALVQLLGRMIAQARHGLLPHLGATDPAVLARLTGAQAAFLARGASADLAHEQAARQLGAALQRQAVVLGYEHLFSALGLLCLLAVPLTLLLRPARTPAA